jgi:electron transport complex protein RnfB
MLVAVMALGMLAGASGLLLGFAAIRFKVEGDPIVEKIDAILPQTQCGQCGFAGCRPYAEAIAAGEADINQCPPGGENGIVALAELLGRDPKPLNPENGAEKPKMVALIDERNCIGCTLCIQACPVDAILGALGEGDIGAHFPPSDPQWKGADSERFLRHAAKIATDAGARIVHVDVTLLCERPKIGPHREAMRARTAEVLGLALSRVSVKATTTERMGFLGREEGLAAQATATVERPA